MSYETAFAANALLGAAIAGLMGGLWSTLASQPPTERRVRWAVRLLAAVAVLLVGAKVAVGLALSSYGWVFAERTLLWDVPLVGIPVLACAVSCWMRWGAPGPDDTRQVSARSAARLAVAAWATVTAASVAAEEFFLRRPSVLLPLAALAAAVGVAVYRYARRDRTTWWAGRTRALQLVGGVTTIALLVAGGTGWAASRLPGVYDLGALASMDRGGGGAAGAHDTHDAAGPGLVSVASLTGPQEGTPDVSYTLVAQRTTAAGRGAPGRHGLSFNGQVPGPALRASEGDLIEVVLRNKDIPSGVSVHWHGYDVPNAEDGVAGVTQDAVRIGGTHTYRFLAEQVGTFWYHSHQASSTQVARGLYGSLVVTPRNVDSAVADLVVVDHSWRGPGGFLEGDKSYDQAGRLERRVLAPGSRARLRLINSRNSPQHYRLVGTTFRVVAIDGGELNAPEAVSDKAVLVAAGGRYDLEFVMPDGPVQLLGLGGGTSLALSEETLPAAELAESARWDLMDPASYGAPLPATTERFAGPYDRDFTMDIDRRLGLIDGRPGYFWAVNGSTYPKMPMYMVAQGDLVRVTIINRTLAHHPIHLHGHHMQVLQRGSRRVSGSPWSSDTLNVAPGERYVIAFRADNPGVWMDHCHDLEHAAQGFVMHVGYEGVTTPFRIGRDSGNQPE